jgi:hypothetical protein
VESLNRNSGLDPMLSYANLTKDELVRLVKTYREYVRKIDGFSYRTVMDKWGNDEAFNCDLKVIEGTKHYEIEAITTVLGIQEPIIATCVASGSSNLTGDAVLIHSALNPFAKCKSIMLKSVLE